MTAANGTGVVGLLCRTSDRSDSAGSTNALVAAIAALAGVTPRIVGTPGEPCDSTYEDDLRDGRGCLLEAGGQLEAAAEAARQATAREPTNWRSWFVLSRIEAERGMVRESIFAYRKTLQLNTRASFLDPG